MKVEKKHSEWGDSDAGRQIWYVSTHMCTLAAKLMLTKIQQQNHRGQVYGEGPELETDRPT